VNALRQCGDNWSDVADLNPTTRFGVRRDRRGFDDSEARVEMTEIEEVRTEKVLEHINNPRNLQIMQNYDGRGGENRQDSQADGQHHAVHQGEKRCHCGCHLLLRQSGSADR